MENELLYRIALTLIPGVGDKIAKTLIAHCGGARAVFTEKRSVLEKIPGIGSSASKNITGQEVLGRAEAELRFIESKDVKPLFYLDQDYPRRLKMCEDGPLMLYYRGNANLNKQQVVAIVGTRNATEYGKGFCEKFIEELKVYNPLIISGLAYGIDIWAHKQALKNGLPTVAVLAHGHDRIYPSTHKSVAMDMLENGGLLTDYLSETNPDRENFPKRNRIVAGISDAVVVVEAARKGGALITAEIANSYNRDVFAVPGNLGNSFSEGCNLLIKQNKAALITSADDLKYILGWEEQQANEVTAQTQLFVELPEGEKQVWDELSKAGKLELDDLCLKLKLPVSKTLQHLMSLELKGLVKSLPGKVYTAR